jgi:hypothetical protein
VKMSAPIKKARITQPKCENLELASRRLCEVKNGALKISDMRIFGSLFVIVSVIDYV